MPLVSDFIHIYLYSNFQVEAGFDEVKRCYIIRTLTTCQKYSQIFINYGPHSNKHLLLNYGFVVDNNPHDVCTVTVGNVCQIMFGFKSFMSVNNFLEG